jgi:small subunit ribosomal protein S6
MNKYEIMFILKSNEEEAIKNQVSELKAIITDMNGEIETEKEMGNRKLAYPIKKELNGYYYVMQVEASHEAISEFDRKALINETILRHLVIRIDEE